MRGNIINKEHILTFWPLYLVILLAFVWCIRYVHNPNGPAGSLIFMKGKYLFSDYHTVQDLLHEPDYYHPVSHPAYDSNLTAICRLIFSVFPDTRPSNKGAIAFAIFSSLIYIGGVAIFAFARKLPVWTTVVACFCTGGGIFSFERGNFIVLAAASMCVFFAWYDDESKWKRSVAAIALAFAGVAKVAPAIFGFLYLTNVRKPKEWMWREIIICGIAAMLLFSVPFFLPGFGGFSGMVSWFENAHENSKYYGLMGSFGLPCIMVWLKGFCKVIGHPLPFSGMAISRGPSALYGVAVFVVSLFVQQRNVRMLMLACAMLIIPGNQFEYCALYVFPLSVMLLASRPQWEGAFLILACFAILPFTICGYGLPPLIRNLAIMGLPFWYMLLVYLNRTGGESKYKFLSKYTV